MSDRTEELRKAAAAARKAYDDAFDAAAALGADAADADYDAAYAAYDDAYAVYDAAYAAYDAAIDAAYYDALAALEAAEKDITSNE